MARAQTLYDKIWASHLVHEDEAGTSLLYIDRHLVHEVTSPQAFEGLRQAARRVRAPHKTLAVADHNVPTSDRRQPIADAESRAQIEQLKRNAQEYGLTYFGMEDQRQGIVHIIGPEQGFTLPGTTIVCGDSHTSTHGAFGALAYGIGTSEVEHVLATQTLRQRKSKNFRIVVKGVLPHGLTAKDVILHIIATIGTGGGTGHVLEYAGAVMEQLSMEGRMTVCNMSIEAGARAGLIAPDERAIAFLKNRPMAPRGDAWTAAEKAWRQLRSDEDAVFDRELVLDVHDLPPLVSWGTSPQDVTTVEGRVPNPADAPNAARKEAMARALAYMGLNPGTPIGAIKIDTVFIGSCTNGRIEDLRAAAAIASKGKVQEGVRAMVVPGSGLVKA
ncbi:MAG: 3-isopropylmalate dehydratase large subunit, partial [Hyphomicrobiales bacterium]|nr:3-isopropylmalate dehydratase large subunit [Hyphomicrobiales bacterium]